MSRLNDLTPAFRQSPPGKAYVTMATIIQAAEGRPLTRAQAADFNTASDAWKSSMPADSEARVSAVKSFVEASDNDDPAAALAAIEVYMGTPNRRKTRDFLESQHGWADEDDARSGSVSAVKSTATFASRYGGSTGVSLDDYLRAAFTGRLDDMPEGMKALSTDAMGTLVLPTTLSNRIIDLSRAASRVVEAGAQTVRMVSGKLTFGRLTQDPAPGWKTENALIAESDAEFEPVEMVARTLAARVLMSVELADDSPTIGNAIESALSASLAQELDRAALLGSGTPPEPRGLVNTSGVTSAGIGSPTGFSDFSTGVEAIRSANLEPNAVIYGPDLAGTLDRLTNLQGDPLTPPASYVALRKLVSSKANGIAAIGDWTQFVVGIRQEVRIEASRQAADENGKGFASYSVLVRATLRADFAVLKPGAFYVLTVGS